MALAVLACGVALAVPQAAPAAGDDAVARRVLETQTVTLQAQFGTLHSCFIANSTSCERSSAFGLYTLALRARARVTALRARALSPRVRSGVDLYVRALDLHARSGYDLFAATQSHDLARIEQAMVQVRHAVAVTNQAMALLYT